MLSKKITVRVLAGLAVLFLVLVPNSILPLCSIAHAQEQTCTPVGGALMTNIGAIPRVTNLGPVFGD